MKIVCESCSAKYSIADEKVAGKVFKIRCKKCSSVIVVRGDQVAEQAQAAQPVADASAGYDPNAIWHVVVNGEQQGPYAPSQLTELMAAGSIDWETYVWREGFDGWLAARDVGDLVEAITGQGQQQSAVAETPFASQGAAGPSEGPTSVMNMGADPFGSMDSQPPQRAQSSRPPASTRPGFGGSDGRVASRAARDGGAVDLFGGGAAASPFGGGNDVVASAPPPAGPRAVTSATMTGARNENSVLFSLANLQALATGSTNNSRPSSRPPMAMGEGSGLIDIRALAGAGGTRGREASARVDDLLSLGTGAPTLGGALGAPILAPVEPERSGRGLVIGMAVGTAVVVLAATGVVAWVVTNTQGGSVADATPIGTITPVTSSTATPAVQAGGSEPAAPGGSASPTVVRPPTDSERRPPIEREPPRSSGSDRPSTPRSGGNERPPTQDLPRNPPNNPPAERPARPAEGSIDELLQDALGSNPTKRAAEPARGNERDPEPPAADNLPETPSRDAVATALRSVQGAVSNCGNGQSGTAMVVVTVSGSSGRVTNAQVQGQFAGTPVGSCVARAVRGARFPRFSRSNFSVTFPYRI